MDVYGLKKEKRKKKDVYLYTELLNEPQENVQQVALPLGVHVATSAEIPTPPTA